MLVGEAVGELVGDDVAVAVLVGVDMLKVNA